MKDYPRHYCKSFWKYNYGFILDNVEKVELPIENIPGKRFSVVMESSGMWYNIYECLSKRHLDVRLSNPVKTRAIASAKIKTDKLDAVKLADLLKGGYIAECYVPNKRIMGLRDIVRHRAALVRTALPRK